ncbi:MAG: hypothetical protein EOP04_11100 [Proteobacteria bacterium]|nr:MAG: hypothetical protein EOP04_11100 [Pseudomonadota bacterium]
MFNPGVPAAGTLHGFSPVISPWSGFRGKSSHNSGFTSQRQWLPVGRLAFRVKLEITTAGFLLESLMRRFEAMTGALKTSPLVHHNQHTCMT